MKQYQRHLEMADKLAAVGNYGLAITNIEALIRSARSDKAKAYLQSKLLDIDLKRLMIIELLDASN